MARYARGARAWGRCARTGDRVLLRDMVKDGDTGQIVTREAYEPKHPQEKPVDVFDPQTLRRQAPDVENAGTFTTNTFTWDPGEIADGATEVKSDITVDGAAIGATVIVYPGVDLQGMICKGYVNGPNTVSVVLANLTGGAINLASSTWQVLVTADKHSKGNTLRVASFNWDPALLVDGATATTTVTVSSAAVGDAVLIYPAQPLNGVLVDGYVSEADTVEVVLFNLSGGSIELGPTVWPRWAVAAAPDISACVAVPIAASADDANEVPSSGVVSIAGTTIGFQDDRHGGFRFDGVALAQGATAPEAHIQFSCAVTASSTGAEACDVTITGEDADDAAAFSTDTSDVSDRTATTASVTWEFDESTGDDAWVAGDRGANELTPNLATIVQEIIDRSGWATGQAMVFMFEHADGDGARVVAAYDDTTYPEAALILGGVKTGKFLKQDSFYTAFWWDPGSINDGATATLMASVAGAEVGDAVILYPGVDLSGLVTTGYVIADDTIEVVLANLTGSAVDLSAANWAARVLSR